MASDELESITQLLNQMREGDQDALNVLFPRVYKTLYAMARHNRMRWHGDFTVNTTALVHEAYLKLVGHHHGNWKDRAHFYALAGKAMRQVLIDHAQRRRCLKRGGEYRKVSLEDGAYEENHVLHDMTLEQADAIVALDEALQKMESEHARVTKMLECKFFSKLTNVETAEALGVSVATVKRDWTFAKAQLHRDIKQIMARPE